MTLEDRVAALEAELEQLRHPLLAIEPLNLDAEEQERFRREFEAAAAQWDGRILPAPPVRIFKPDEVRQFLQECVTAVGAGETLILRTPDLTPVQVREYQDWMDALRECEVIPFRVLVVIGDELGVVESSGDVTATL
jgi:hypothetical protein